MSRVVGGDSEVGVDVVRLFEGQGGDLFHAVAHVVGAINISLAQPLRNDLSVVL
jgi:hypothetical protein